MGDALKAQAAALGIDDRCSWLGAQSQKQVFAALARADLFVLASKKAADGDQDGLPNVLMEAAHQGLPIVSTRAAAIAEFVDDGANGLLVSPGAADELAVALERLARDPGLRRRLADAAARTVRSRFSYEAGVDWIASALGQPRLAQARAAE
jgi:glycosyltransferase involved in cell wall biosynthesis